MSLTESLRILTTHCRPRRLLQEDFGVKAPLWFGRKPDSPLHIPANILRLLCAITLGPIYIFIPHLRQSLKSLAEQLLWSVEWSQAPDAVLLEAPGAQGKGQENPKVGEYAVIGNKPKWLLEVHFKNGKVISRRQVRYSLDPSASDSESVLGAQSSAGLALRKSIQQSGYVAISYFMESAKQLLDEAKRPLDPQPEIEPNGQRQYSLRNRRNISQMVLEEYARARTTMGPGKADGYEFIWLDEFCLSDDAMTAENEIKRQRSLELGQLTDIFRGARKVVVFCHVAKCDHTGTDCPWGKRLFTLGEILNTSEVLQMTRTEDSNGQLTSSITSVPGQDFRADMQARAAEAKLWHLYNIMQYATSSGAVSWQSAIQSLVVEAIRRDEANDFNLHHFLGKALNGLLPRKSQLEDLQGVNGWADLAWLLELNQGYYNAALLAAVCKLADPWVAEYRWWGKPIAPKEGCERLEALVTAIPVKIRNERGILEPVLSIIGPQSIKLIHMLRRDSGALYHQPEMRSLRMWTIATTVILFIVGLATLARNPGAGSAVMWLSFEFLIIIELLVGTIYVTKDAWVAFEDHLIPGRDPGLYLQSQDPTFTDKPQWGPRQLIPEWDRPQSNGPSLPGETPRPYPITLMDLRTGVLVRAAATSRPNNMVVLAVHGSGITCMLLDRDDKATKATISTKAGMANLPPFVLAQAVKSGTVYVGGGPLSRHKPTPRGDPAVTSPSPTTKIIWGAPPNQNLNPTPPTRLQPQRSTATAGLSKANPSSSSSVGSFHTIATSSNSALIAPQAASTSTPGPNAMTVRVTDAPTPAASGNGYHSPFEPAHSHGPPHMTQTTSPLGYPSSFTTHRVPDAIPTEPRQYSPRAVRRDPAEGYDPYQEVSGKDHTMSTS